MRHGQAAPAWCVFHGLRQHPRRRLGRPWGQLYRKGDTVNPQRGQVIRRVDSGQCCDCMPGCERSTPDVVGGCFGDPSIRECCCNERSYTSTYAETHDFKRWTYFSRRTLSRHRELIEEYTESVVQLGVRQVVDNAIVIDQPCIARRIGREYDRTDEFGNRVYYEYDIMVEYYPPSWGAQRRSSSRQTTTFRSGSGVLPGEVQAVRRTKP